MSTQAIQFAQNEHGNVQFEPAPGSHLSEADARRYGPALQKLCAKKHGITAEDLVEEASHPKSVFRDWFTWDDSLAAKQYRLEQARSLMRSIQVRIIVTPQEAPVTLRVMHCVHREEGKKYDFINAIAQVPDELDEILQRALHELIGWRTRYAALQKLSPIFKPIDLFVAETEREQTLKLKTKEAQTTVQQTKTKEPKRALIPQTLQPA